MTTNQEKEFFTLAEVQRSKELKQVEKGLDQYKILAETTVVNCQGDYDQAAGFCKNVKSASKKIEEKRKFFVNPYNLVIKKINGLFKDKVKQLEEIEKIVKNKMLIWHKVEQIKIEREQAKIAEQNRKKLDRQQKKMEENPDKIYAPPALKTAPADLDKTSKTDTASATVRNVWKWEVQDLQKIPRYYMIVDEKKINKLVNGGMREIPGLRIYCSNELAIK